MRGSPSIGCPKRTSCLGYSWPRKRRGWNTRKSILAPNSYSSPRFAHSWSSLLTRTGWSTAYLGMTRRTRIGFARVPNDVARRRGASTAISGRPWDARPATCERACLALVKPDRRQVLPEIVAGRHIPALDLLVVDD